LSANAQADVVAYVEGQLALLSDANLVAGTAVSLYGYIQIADIHRDTTALTTDYGYQRIGGNDPAANKNGVLDGNLLSHDPLGAMLQHLVHAGDTLQSLAALYYGSPSYWLRIPAQAGTQFRRMPAPHSGPCRRVFRTMPAGSVLRRVTCVTVLPFLIEGGCGGATEVTHAEDSRGFTT
jgi:hypothetical protein